MGLNEQDNGALVATRRRVCQPIPTRYCRTGERVTCFSPMTFQLDSVQGLTESTYVPGFWNDILPSRLGPIGRPGLRRLGRARETLIGHLDA